MKLTQRLKNNLLVIASVFISVFIFAFVHKAIIAIIGSTYSEMLATAISLVWVVGSITLLVLANLDEQL